LSLTLINPGRFGRKIPGAADFFQRAYSVSEDAGDSKTMKDVAVEMKRLKP